MTKLSQAQPGWEFDIGEEENAHTTQAVNFSGFENERTTGGIDTEGDESERGNVPVSIQCLINSSVFGETYHPMIVIGCATENRTFLAIFMRRKRFDTRAIPSCAALTAISLCIPY